MKNKDEEMNKMESSLYFEGETFKLLNLEEIIKLTKKVKKWEKSNHQGIYSFIGYASEIEVKIECAVHKNKFLPFIVEGKYIKNPRWIRIEANLKGMDVGHYNIGDKEGELYDLIRRVYDKIYLIPLEEECKRELKERAKQEQKRKKENINKQQTVLDYARRLIG